MELGRAYWAHLLGPLKILHTSERRWPYLEATSAFIYSKGTRLSLRIASSILLSIIFALACRPCICLLNLETHDCILPIIDCHFFKILDENTNFAINCLIDSIKASLFPDHSKRKSTCLLL